MEATLDKEIDGYRDLIVEGKPKTALKLLQQRLQNLPSGASDKIIFRVKANIGACYLQLDDKVEAQRWLLDAYAAAPTEPKAIANKAIALITGDRSREAYDSCREALEAEPGNEYAAAYLLQAAMSLDVDDPFDLIPAALKEREEVLLSRIAFLCERERRAEWWDLARRTARAFPLNDRVAFFSAQSEIDEALRDPSFRRFRQLDEARRKRLKDAAETLEGQWERILNSEAPDRDYGITALANAMLARQALGDFDLALNLAAELIKRSSGEALLLNAVQVAQFSHRQDLALDGLAKLGGSPKAQFLRAMVHLERNEWNEAVTSFAAAEIPEEEKSVAETVVALAPVRAAPNVPDESAFEPALRAAAQDARSLVVVGRAAAACGVESVADKAFADAVALLNPQSTLAERSMVAAYAAAKNDASLAIEILDGHVQEGHPSEELLRLAEAHAIEHPGRTRNLDFFERLPPAIRDLKEFARPRASVLLRSGKTAEAAKVFRTLVESEPTDVYSHMGHAEALRRQGRATEVAPLILAADENAMRGPAEYRMNFAHELKAAGAPERALKYAYALVREAPDNPKVALGYVFLILGESENKIIPDLTDVGKDTWVKIENSAGENSAFTIDDGASFFGIDVRAADQVSVKKVLGRRKGDSFDINRDPLPTETWKITEIKSKFLHLLHVVMESFEQKFPDAKGMWRFTVKDGDIAPVLDVIRKLSEANQQRAKTYTEGTLPLAFVAKMMGGDAPSFAQYVRGMGANIATCTGQGDEFVSGGKLADEARAKGAVLDLYTAWVAAELGILDILKSWFGRLLTPQSTIDEIDRLIAREEEGIGRRQMTVGWQDGQFVRQEVTDEFIERQIAALTAIKKGIISQCEMMHVILPNDLPELALKIFELFGDHILDPIYVAHSEKMILLSDDLRYRDVARAVADVGGLWLQAALATALGSGAAERARVIKAYIHLAARKHDHVRLDSEILRDVYEACTDTQLREFDVITDFIGVEKADMYSHTMVTGRFLSDLWKASNGDLKSQAATGIIISKLVRFRSEDWAIWLALLMHGTTSAVVSYLERWLFGHFIPAQPVVAAYRAWQAKFRRIRRTIGQVSAEAMRIAGAI